ncbi:MAG TPA: hypothetical protein VIQ30_14065 [Pseudonocardia sp.]
MTSRDLSTLFQGDPSAPSQGSIRQGVVEAWNPDTGENSVQIAGGTIVNIPSLTAEAAEVVAGDVVAVWTSGDRALVLGKVTTPGDPGTVPTWNADLEALAPLADLAAVTTGLTVMGATNVTTDPGDGAHVVINDPLYPGQIAMYSGNPSELTPGLIFPILGDANYGVVEIHGPILNAGGHYAYLALEGYDDDHTNLKAAADNVRFEGNATFTLINWSGAPVQIGNGTDFVNVTGKVVTNADLSSTTNTFPANPQPVVATSSTSGGLTVTGTTFIPTATVCGTSFTAPPTGSVYVTLSVTKSTTSSGALGYSSFEIRTGSTVGSGTVFTAASLNAGVAVGATVTGITIDRIQASRRVLVTGLTAGATYNVQTMHQTTPSGNTVILYREVLIEPVL